VTLTFILDRPGRVVFLVTEVSPVCRVVGRFTVLGHAGVNRFRFAGRVARKKLGAGTYQISVRVPGGPVVRRITLIVVGRGVPSRAELTSARTLNACVRGGTATTGASNSGFLAGSGPEPGVTLPPQDSSAGGPLRGSGSGTDSGGVLGSNIEKTVRALRPALIALLLAAIVLLGIASLPRFAVPGPRAHELLAQHRLEIAGVGAALFAVVVAFLLT
jgi:hypothetical protein